MRETNNLVWRPKQRTLFLADAVLLPDGKHYAANFLYTYDIE